MKRKTDPMLILTVIVVLGMIGSSILSGTKNVRDDLVVDSNTSFAQNDIE